MKPVPLTIVCLAAFSTANAGIRSELLADGFERPVWAGAPETSPGKLWVMEQAGTVWVIDLANGKREAEPFLDITEDVERRSNEQGLLGLAFAPDFAQSGRFYVNFNEKKGDTRIERFGSKDGKADLSQRDTVYEFKQPYGNHNGGWLDFGPDGYLYVATGDGGAANDPKNKAQDLKSPLGKVLRFDVSGDGKAVPAAGNSMENRKGALPEIHAYGLRNPWRCSFDRETGDFWIGDVGQNAWEEINFVKGGDIAGMNFGWRLREGRIETPKKKIGGEKPERNVEPIYVYKHGRADNEGRSVTGGFVYRGTKVPELEGRYVFADYQNSRIWSFVEKDGKATDFKDHTNELQPRSGKLTLISSFGEDADGELYLADHTGKIFRILDR